jgi:hypothetical protein
VRSSRCLSPSNIVDIESGAVGVGPLILSQLNEDYAKGRGEAASLVAKRALFKVDSIVRGHCFMFSIHSHYHTFPTVPSSYLFR